MDFNKNDYLEDKNKVLESENDYELENDPGDENYRFSKIGRIIIFILIVVGSLGVIIFLDLDKPTAKLIACAGDAIIYKLLFGDGQA